MERITMSIDEDLAKEFDALIAKRGYASRSEAMRDLLRREVEGQPGRVRSAGLLRREPLVRLQPPRARARRAPGRDQHAHHDLSSRACTCTSTTTTASRA